MTISDWLTGAVADADQRGLPELGAVLRTIALTTDALRRATWNVDASGEQTPAPKGPHAA